MWKATSMRSLLFGPNRRLDDRIIMRYFSTTTTTTELVHFEVKKNVGIITLNAPQRLNALTLPMGVKFQSILDSIDYRSVHALVVRGAGRAFSAGGDFEFLRARAADTGSRNSMLMKQFYDMYLGSIRRVPVPTISAIHGPAVGAGCCLSLGCDLRLATKTARLGVTFVSIGLHPGMGATHFLPLLVGPQLAARMCLTGELLTGVEAAQHGLVLEAVDGEAEEVMARAMDLAGRIVKNAPVAVRSCVRSLRMQTDAGLDASLWREADAQSYCYSGQDLTEGVEAVAGKRPPIFTQAEDYRL